jgi:transcriptional regulator with XRE-family HTH domain
MGFGTQLRTAREQAGLSQQELADKAGISVDSVQNWEQGRTRPRLPALGKLAQALGVSLDVLVMAEGKAEPTRPRGRPRKGEGEATKPKGKRKG